MRLTNGPTSEEADMSNQVNRGATSGSRKHEEGEHEGGHSDHGQDDKQLTLVVHAPRSPDSKTFTWAKTMKVGDAAKEAAVAFGYAGGNPSFQTLATPPRQLDKNKTLVAEHLKDGDEIEITDTGGGV